MKCHGKVSEYCISSECPYADIDYPIDFEIPTVLCMLRDKISEDIGKDNVIVPCTRSGDEMCQPDCPLLVKCWGEGYLSQIRGC